MCKLMLSKIFDYCVILWTWSEIFISYRLFPSVYNRRALSESEEEGDYVTRYDRITGAQQDFSVFSSNLPGTHIHADIILTQRRDLWSCFHMSFNLTNYPLSQKPNQN